MIHYTIRVFLLIAILGCLSSSAYYLLCLWSVRSFLRQQKADRSVRPTQSLPPVSILKPLKGVDPEIYESFRSHCVQDYPEYEIVFGVSDADDPAVASVERLKTEFPDRAIRLVVCSRILGANVKVSNLQQMLPHARYPQLIVNDSDIRVERDYLRRVIAPFIAEEDHVGMVTCLYRGVASPTLGSRLESLGICTDFCAGVLVARQLEHGLHFGLGSTLAFRREDLELAGGFQSIVDFLSDDYQLGRKIADLGLNVHLSDVIVETHLPAYDLRGFLAHQLRWARSVRDSRAAGYVGLITTFGLMWALLAVAAAKAAPWSLGLFLGVAVLRLAVAIAVGKIVLKDSKLMSHLWLLPLRDLIAMGVWFASFLGHTVTWRGDRFELKDGRLTRIADKK
jgi:ceramide glucosyltransferase